MTTIDKLDLSVYNLYAVRTRMIEQINQQLRLQDAASVAPQLQMVDIYPRLSELDLVLGVAPLYTPWAYFFPPRSQNNLRRSPFAFYRVIPSLNSDQEQDDCERMLDQAECETPEELHEKEALKRCFAQIGKLNEWLSFIIGRIGQFLQG